MTASSFIWGTICKRPRLFNGLSGGVLCAASDAFAQDYEHRHERRQNQHQHGGTADRSLQRSSQLDWFRCSAAGALGVFLGGGVYPSTYAWLDRLWAGTTFTNVVKKSFTEILTVGIFVNSLSMAYRGMLRGDHTPTEVLEHVADEIPTVTRNDLLIWGPYNLAAFSLIPIMIRPATTACCEACWQAYISLRSHNFEEEGEEREAEAPESAKKKNACDFAADRPQNIGI